MLDYRDAAVTLRLSETADLGDSSRAPDRMRSRFQPILAAFEHSCFHRSARGLGQFLHDDVSNRCARPIGSVPNQTAKRARRPVN